jgi:hypothetical protein
MGLLGGLLLGLLLDGLLGGHLRGRAAPSAPGTNEAVWDTRQHPSSTTGILKDTTGKPWHRWMQTRA